MKKVFTVLIFGGLFLGKNWVYAQDLHFSQFYCSPLSINPALTGNFNGDYRVGLNARSQWAAVTVPYQTLSVYGDMGVAQDMVGDNNWIGIGTSFFLDRAGDGELRTIKSLAHVAFHKHLNDNIFLSLGAGFGYIQKSIDLTQLTFSSQWDGIGFDGNINNLESFEKNKFGYLDVSSGLALSFLMEDRFIGTIGASVQHINRPLESFYFTDNNGGNNQLGYRPVIHFSSDINFSPLHVYPSAMFTMTKKTNEMVLGANVGYFMQEPNDDDNNSMGVFSGLWYRTTGSFIVLVGFEMSRVRLLLNYDLDIGQLAQFSNSRNGFELSISHVGSFREPPGRLYCPRF